MVRPPVIPPPTQVAGYESLPKPKGTAGTSPIYVQIPVNVDEWVYNFGPQLADAEAYLRERPAGGHNSDWL